MKQNVALTPPMGWNSWDCYGASVTEDDVRGNAEYMAKYLKPFGWEYIVVDIQWYEPTAFTSKYLPFADLEMDGFSRLMPAVNRFPSAVDGNGFRPLADYVHSLGLQFGIHIMRGIPRQAVHEDAPILGTDHRARDIAHTSSICKWNTDMYGVDPSKPGAQTYYDSLFQLYASWTVDFVKVDDCSRSFIGDQLYFDGEVELIRNAIDQCGRNIVLSLSPGPAPIEYADHLKTNANMWRMTNDYWDRWEDLLLEFEKCNEWSPHVGPGHWPDADMLPLGHIGIRSSEHGQGDRCTLFTRDEQVTMMSLWCIFRSPLMFGGELQDNDDWTLSLLTNEEVLRVLRHSHGGRQLLREDPIVLWTAADEDESKGSYAALFNLGETEIRYQLTVAGLGFSGTRSIRDLWRRQDLGEAVASLEVQIPPHGSRLFRLA
ncbi:MAG TPA: glycoside hydrolase family 27 protein [Clostridia bacterium]